MGDEQNGQGAAGRRRRARTGGTRAVRSRSSLPKGSSSSSARGAATRLRISATRARCPPESVAGSRSAKPASPASASAVRRRARRAARARDRRIEPEGRCSRRPMRCGNNRSSWNMRPTPRRSGGNVVTSRPSTITRPLAENAGSRWPPMKPSSADLPAPLGPMIGRRLAGLDAERQAVDQRAPARREGRPFDDEAGRVHGSTSPRRCDGGSAARRARRHRRRSGTSACASPTIADSLPVARRRRRASASVVSVATRPPPANRVERYCERRHGNPDREGEGQRPRQDRQLDADKRLDAAAPRAARSAGVARIERAPGSASARRT